MSDPVSAAKSARESLARALSAIQSDAAVPPHVMAVAEPISNAMGALFQIERSGGAAASTRGPVALEAVRRALGLLQQHPRTIPRCRSRSRRWPARSRWCTASPERGGARAASGRRTRAGLRPTGAASGYAPGPPAAYQQPPARPQAYPAGPPAQPYAAPPQQPPPQPHRPTRRPTSLPWAHRPLRSRRAAACSGATACTPSPSTGGPRRALGSKPSSAPTASRTFYKGLSRQRRRRARRPLRRHLQHPAHRPDGHAARVDAGRLRVRRARRREVDARNGRLRSGGRRTAQPGFGAQFTQITPEARQLVYRYVRNREPLFHDDL